MVAEEDDNGCKDQLTEGINHMLYSWCRHDGYSSKGICLDRSGQEVMWKRQDSDRVGGDDKSHKIEQKRLSDSRPQFQERSEIRALWS